MGKALLDTLNCHAQHTGNSAVHQLVYRCLPVTHSFFKTERPLNMSTGYEVKSPVLENSLLMGFARDRVTVNHIEGIG